jgi:hypothetical protein
LIPFRLYSAAQRSTKAYLGLVCEREESLHQSIQRRPPAIEKLRLLHSFCLTGDVPQTNVDTFVKDLLTYRLLDIVAYVHGMASEDNMKEKGSLPFIDKLVRHLVFASPLWCENYTCQGHAAMGNWPRVVDTAAASMKSDKTLPLSPSVRSEIANERLSACFRELCSAMGNLHRAKIIQNFAAAAFHLCYLLRVRIYFCSVTFYSQ